MLSKFVEEMDISLNEMIPIYKPYLKKYKKSALEVIESEWISNHGKYVELATNKLKNLLNIPYCILMMNGTVATHCLFLALKYKYPQINTIYVPNNVYVAVYNTTLMEYEQSNIEVMKIDPKTWNLNFDEEYIKTLKSNSCIVIVHNLGNIIDVEKIKKIRPDVIILEDNCEGLFGKYNQIYSGTSKSTLCSSISFYGNKNITTGEGGAFLTHDIDIYNYISKVYSQGMSSVRYIHNLLAFNYRMTNLQASFLYDQLNDIENIIDLKRNIFENYLDLFSDLIKSGEILIQEEDKDTERANWIFSIQIINNNLSIEETSLFFTKYNIEIRPFFYPFYKHSHLSKLICHEENLISNFLNQSIIMIPSYPEITYLQQQYIVEKVKLFIQTLKCD
jgi:perosamine synthetase